MNVPVNWISRLLRQPQLRSIGTDFYYHMIRRFLCLLLVPLMLANQDLCFGHVHGGSDFAEPKDHESRPHYHFGGQNDRAHDHQHSGRSHEEPTEDSDEQEGSRLAIISPIGSHDSDAVYCTELLTGAREGNSARIVSAKHVAGSNLGHLADHRDRLLRRGQLRGQPMSLFDAGCPIYLRTLSLRI